MGKIPQPHALPAETDSEGPRAASVSSSAGSYSFLYIKKRRRINQNARSVLDSTDSCWSVSPAGEQKRRLDSSEGPGQAPPPSRDRRREPGCDGRRGGEDGAGAAVSEPVRCARNGEARRCGARRRGGARGRGRRRRGRGRRARGILRRDRTGGVVPVRLRAPARGGGARPGAVPACALATRGVHLRRPRRACR